MISYCVLHIMAHFKKEKIKSLASFPYINTKICNKDSWVKNNEYITLLYS